MYLHEIYTESSSAARYIAKTIGGDIQSYSIAPDRDMHIVTTRKRYGHEKMISNLNSINVNYEEVITYNKL
ncbi:unknown function [Klebsiella phage vB_Kpn_K22PH164C1]|uniref:Uncharacterized protein n=1 Tax=Klebsiella phage vB_Kpn_K22PH164C1 TaxID=3071617 RepID=A0AAV1MIW5_9CAUD|nr:unknown function [Klebsiella phage vB_Kpn_K22PH164C1]